MRKNSKATRIKIPSAIRLKLAGSLILCLVAAFLFGNTIHNEFTNWDDQALIVKNSAIRSLDVDNLKQIFNPLAGGTYQPLRVFSYALDYRFFELNPVGYHIHNIILHALAGVFLFLALCRMLPQITGVGGHEGNRSSQDDFRFIFSAFLAALLFVIHPVNVESVTWLSSRKYVLLGFFAFLSVYLYVRAGAISGKKAFVLNLLSFVCMACAVLSSPFGVVVPALFVLYEYARDTRFNPVAVLKTRFLQLSPYLIGGTGLLILLVSKLVRSDGGASTFHHQEKGFYTLLTVFQVIFDYMRNFVCPLWLNNRYVDYIYHGFGDYYKVWAGLLILLAVAGITTWQLIRNNRMPLFCAGWFFLNWLPASNIIPISTKMADRYVYLASVGVFVCFSELVVIAGYGAVNRYASPKNKKFVTAVTAFLLVSLVGFYGFQTVQRNKVWENSGTLWMDSIEKDPRNAMAYNNLGNFQFARGNAREAEKNYRIALALSPEDKLAGPNLGSLLMAQGRLDEAISIYKKMLTYHPDSLVIYRALADLYIQQDKLETAAEYFNKILEITPDDPVTISWQGSVLRQLKRYDQAQEVVEKGLKRFPENPEIGVVYAEIMLDTGRLGSAGAAFQKVIDSFPKDVRALEGMGKVFFQENDMAQAEHYYRKGLEIHAGNPSLHNNLGNALQAMEKWDEALAAYQKALDMSPEFEEARFNFCVVTGKKGNPEKALACYLDFLATCDHAQSMNNAAHILIQKQEWDQARELLEKAVDVAPEFADAMFNLGVVYQNLGRYEKALACFEKVVSLRENDAGALNSIGILAHEMGDLDKAAAFFEKTLALSPDQPGIHFNLGMVQLKKKEVESAYFHFKTVLRSEPDNRVAADIVKQIDQALEGKP